jgi:hypothetical protein
MTLDISEYILLGLCLCAVFTIVQDPDDLQAHKHWNNYKEYTNTQHTQLSERLSQ